MPFVDWLRRRLSLLRWRESRSLSSSEWGVLTALLSGSDPRLRRTMLQWKMASRFSREFMAPDESEIRIQWRATPGNLSHITLADTASEPITVCDDISKRQLRFVLKVGSGGSCFPLIGKALDGDKWPLSWSLGSIHISALESGNYMQLPGVADQTIGIRRLEAWLGKTIDVRGFEPFYEVFAAASHGTIAETERRLGIDIPPAYREFLLASDGLLVGEMYLLGTGLSQLVHLPPETKPSVILLAQDGVNGPNDGFYFMYTSGKNRGKVARIDFSAEITQISESLPEFVDMCFELLQKDYQEYTARK